MVNTKSLVFSLAVLLTCVSAQGPGEDAEVIGRQDLVWSMNELGRCIVMVAQPAGRNIVVCPPAVTSVLLAVLPAATLGSRSQIARCVSSSLDVDDRRLLGAFRDYVRALKHRDGLDFGANCTIWLASGMSYREEYRALLEKVLGAETRQFRWDEGGVARDVGEGSGQVDGAVDHMWLQIAGVVDLKAKWAAGFERHQTALNVFEGWNESQYVVPFMYGDFTLAYAEREDCQLTRVRLRRCDLAVDFCLPKQVEELASLRPRLASLVGDDPIGEMGPRRVDLWMPALNVVSRLDLGSSLAAMGMMDVLSDSRLLAGGFVAGDQVPRGGVAVRQVVQLSADEEGLGVAAKCELRAGPSARDAAKPVVFLGRPFAMVVRDLTTNAVLVAAAIGNPGDDRDTDGGASGR